MNFSYLKPWLIVSSVLFLAFVFLGDRVLPEPLGPASAQTRVTLNNFFVGLIPRWERKTNPYGRTEEAIETEESGGKAPQP
ncbi:MULTISPECIES: hypothetical protein [Roseofilum]|uniref:Uncharacterized protein n=1 Tax=Roseofilum reptotaenium AO1-A TaxID=1925591 RepID=A0A1L9QSF8_9CYAN|nr:MULTISPECIES: hypothetical protein [Roseofilum]OJJ25630.1 hypothetical protein BI308_10820 [Roseofilum reptotaenium AO1-A]HBR00208.1 hypothetical protein [Cyanobacteria bacterium UBA11691]MBP0010848.1 hypothetical protein [Roseofilum sp. Belize Diploria]MBP0035351.1 hypothetical protein [Roseofilum sp. Belize BBD 4]MDB9519580.1 hypothetical protein [Roseofilum reptotaenium CS-1145]